MVTVAPTMDDARRAAEELIAAGAGRVLLFGSLARGEQRGASDIDLVAVYDDLDYAERARRRCALERRARSASGFDVDVIVTDLPEWTVRSERVPASVEARIAAEAICLADGSLRCSLCRSPHGGGMRGEADSRRPCGFRSAAHPCDSWPAGTRAGSCCCSR